MDKETQRKEKVKKAIEDKKIVDDTSFTVFQMVEDLKEEVDQKLADFQKEQSPEAQIEKVAIKLATKLAVLEKGDKGDDGYTPVKGVDYDDGEDGENYILTDKDKEEIASKIKVPVVEKEIETIREIETRIEPIVTENVVEKAMYEEPNQIVAKINTATELIDKNRIKGFSDLEKISKMNAFNPTMGPSFSDLARLQANIDAKTTNLTGYLQNNVGISGGTTLIGGTGASENLTLSSTSNATKGKIYFGSNSFFDETNDRLIIGSGSPTTYAFSVTGGNIFLGSNSVSFGTSQVTTINGSGNTTISTGNTVYGIALRSSTTTSLFAKNGQVTIGSSANPVSVLTVPIAPTAIADYGTISLGSGAFDGTTAGFFAGSASGTQLAINQASGSANFVDFQLAGVNKFKVSSLGVITALGGLGYYGAAQAIQPSADGSTLNTAGRVTIYISTNFTGNYYDHNFLNSVSQTATTGTQGILSARGGFAPTSGTAVYNLLDLEPTINQTGGANGITRGLYINPTLTAAADFRALEIAKGVTLLATYTFATLPTGIPTGSELNISDSNTTTWGATIAGGSTNSVKARYNGTNWTVVGI